MKTLIVYAHPNQESLNYSFLKTVEKSSKTAGHEVQVLDLYKNDFDPRLVFNKENRRRDMHKAPEMAPYREQMLWAERIVYIYPIFWGRPPAILLGYFDRLLASGFAYQPIEGKPMPEGLMKDKEVICISTMAGPSIYPALFINNAPKVLMKKAVCGFIGIKKVKFFQFGNMEKTGDHITKKLKKVETFFLK